MIKSLILVACTLFLSGIYLRAEGYVLNTASAPPQFEAPEANVSSSHVFVTFGAFGDLAEKFIYPSLWGLFRDDLLPNGTIFFACDLRETTVSELRAKVDKNMNVRSNERVKYEEFWRLNHYLAGGYNTSRDFELLDREIIKFELVSQANRLFYLAVPPSVFATITELLKSSCMSPNGWNRLVIEKPFGKDTESSNELDDHLNKLFTKDQIYRIDHFLGEEMVQNLMTVRFENTVFLPIWNRANIASVLITLKEPFGVEGRGGYFDQYGIIRDVMQNHLLQILTLVAMEKPASYHPDDIRNEKVKLLESIDTIKMEDVVLGQYVGYSDDPTVPDGSTTSTYALNVLYINNERWNGVPFILQAGKALNEHKAEVRIQYKNHTDVVFGEEPKRNEFITRLYPNAGLYLKMMIKTPGISFDIEQSELNLTYAYRYKDVKVPSPYERLILDVFHGSQSNFVQSDELSEAWRIFTPVLHEIDDDQIPPIPYMYGSIGPEEANKMLNENNFICHGPSC